MRRLRTFFEGFAVPDPSLAGIAGELEILRELKRVNWAGVFAQSAEHAAAQVIGKIGEFFSSRLLVARAGNHDQILRACQRTEIAGNAHGFVGIGVDVQARRTPVSFGNLRPFQRVLLGIDLFWILIAERDLQSLEKVDKKNLSQKRGHPHTRVAYHWHAPVASGPLAGRFPE